MAFQLANFDVIKQHYDKTGLFHYHESVGATADPTTGRTGDAISAIIAANYFNPVIDQLAIGAVIIISTSVAVKVAVVTGLYDTDGTTPKVVVAAIPAA